MAETAFAQGEPIWDEFDAEYDATEYHSDWSYYSDGGFFSDEEQAGEDGKKSKVGSIGAGLTGATRGVKEGSGGTGQKMTDVKVAGRPARKRRRLMVVDDNGKETPGKVTATVIVPPITTPAKQKSVGDAEEKINGVDQGIYLNKDPSTTNSVADVTTMRAAMKRKPSTDEAAVSP